MSAIEITGLQKHYGKLPVLKDIALTVQEGEFIVFIGPSGCGKSTLLRCISGLEPISAGTICIGGRDMANVPLEKRGIAMVFQSYALYPHLDIFGNIAFSLRLQGLPAAEIRRKVHAVAEKLHLTPYLDRLPALLSGGQRQRVAIGRAIVRDPKVFLFDEPLSNLDADLRVKMRMEIAQLKQQLSGTTMIYVTHDQVEAMTLADRIVVLRDGRIEAVGTSLDLYERPSSVFVAGFIGSPRMNLISGARAWAFGVPTIGIRPEALTTIESDTAWQGQVVHAEHLGSDTFAYVDIGEADPVIIRLAGGTRQAVGQTLRFAPIAGQVHRFGADGLALPRPDDMALGKPTGDRTGK